MKKTNIILAVLMLMLSVSCGRKVNFEHETFITLYTNSIDVNEDAGKLLLPVSIYNPTGDEVTVTVTVTDGKAVSPKDYKVVSPDILVFAGDVDTQNIEIDIVDYSGELTGSKDFHIKIESATYGVDVGEINEAVVTIKDTDHPLDKIFLGKWTGTAVVPTSSGDMPVTMNITIIPDDDDMTFTKVLIQNLDPMMEPNTITAVSNAEKNKLAIKVGQPVGDIEEYEEKALFGAYNSSNQSTGLPAQDLEISLTENGTLVIEQYFGSYFSLGWWTLYYDGGTNKGIILTRAK